MGNGSVIYSGISLRNESITFTTIEGTSAKLEILPDKAYKIKRVIINSVDVTSSIIDNRYAINSINSDMTVNVEFESVQSPIISFTDSIVKQICVKKWDTNGDGELSEAEADAVDDIGTSFRKSSIESFPEFKYFTGLSSIASEAFEKCSKLKTIILPNNIKSIGHQAFKESSINNLLIPDGVETIVYEAFEACQGLERITLPNSISHIGVNAFYGNTSLAYVQSEIKIPFEINWAVFVNLPDNAELHVPYGTKKLYETTNGWNVFGKIIEAEPQQFDLNIATMGNGSVICQGKTIRNQSQNFSVQEGSSVVLSFDPDAGYRIASVKLNNTDVTASVTNSSYTISNITSNVTLTVTFEAIPPTTYTLTISAVGNGIVTYDGNVLKGKTSSFTVVEGTNVLVKFAADEGYRLKSVKLNTTDVTASVANNQYTISNFRSDNTLEVEFETIPHTLTIKATGNGSATFNSTVVKGKSMSFIVNEGTSAVVKFSLDAGNKIKSVKLNNTDVTSSVTNSQYTISNINSDNILEVEFEAIIHTLSIVAVGNGNAGYNGLVIRNQSQSYSVQEGSSVDISFTPDTGYRIASVKLNNTDVTASVVNNSYTISNITANTTLAVTFEEIPPTVYDLVIKATGNGEVDNGAYSVRNKSMTFKVTEGSSVTVSFVPDSGYRLKSVKLDNEDVTSSVVGRLYTISNIKANTTLDVVFEETPPTAYSFSITASGNGSVIYDGNTIKGKTSTFTIIEGSYITVQLSADDGYRLKRVTLNGLDVTADVANDQYTTPKMMADATLIVEFEVIPNITDAGVAYTVTSYDEQTVVVAAGNYGNVLTVPASFTAKEKTWTVVGIDEDALKDNTALAAIIWNPEVAFTAKVSNPNLLLYVKDAQYAPTTIQNVVVNNQAENIVLVEAASGNDFYCPQAFTAKRISYEHNYSMISGYKTCQGWETLVLPFDVTTMINAKGQELTPYINWQYGNSLRPFWLYEMTTQGWKAGSAIKANTPYIISMPNNEMYDVSFNQTGNIQFIGTNVEVKASTEMKTGQHGNKRLVANYQTQEASADIYALNVSNEWSQNTATEAEGSTFIRSLRSVHPFEAYLTVEGSNAPWAIPLFENMPTGINEKLIVNSEKFATATDWYTIDGRKLQGEPKQNGIYIIKGKKVRK